MSSCCGGNNVAKRRDCPVSKTACREVSSRTILHQLTEAWAWEKKDQRYYFCDDPACDVVYFGDDDVAIKQSDLRTTVGIKNKQDGLVCYCFGVSFEAALADPLLKKFVMDKTKNKLCACEIRNPSGKCCLKDFP